MSNRDNDQDSLSARLTDESFDGQLEHDYHDLLRRIAADGAAWRRALPTTDALARHTHSLGVPPLLGEAPVILREDTRMEPSVEPRRAPSGRPEAPLVQREPSRFHRSRQLLAALAALVVVALFISVFAAQSHKRGPSGSGTATTATTAKTPTTIPASARLAAVPTLKNLPNPPVIAPSDPRTLYLVNGAHLTRSNDGGATWTTLPDPANFPAGLTVSWIDLFVSPLDAKTVYATANLSNPDNSQVNNCPAPLPLGHIGAKVALSGVIPCEATEISTDGGATWSILRLPGNYELGNASPNSLGVTTYDNYSANPVAQSNQITIRLYSLAGHGPLASVGPDRLFSSGDAGVTWQYADSALVARGQNPCQFVAPSLGATLYAVTVPSTSFCDPAYNATQQLWRSDDGGASWRQLGLPAGRMVLAAVVASGQQPILYLLMPPASTQAHVGVAGATGGDIYASADGGATWTHPLLSGTASTSSIPSDGATTLSDGSLAVVLDEAPLVELYRWKLGGSPWTAIASTDNVTAPVSLVNIPAQGHDVLWLTVAVGSNPATATYTVYTDTP